MRQQTRAYILAHGGNPDAMSEDDFNSIMVCLNDGFIGNKQILNSIGSLTAGVFNYIRGKNQSAYRLQNIIGLAYDYIYPPKTEQQKKDEANSGLLAFISMMPGAEKQFNHG